MSVPGGGRSGVNATSATGSVAATPGAIELTTPLALIPGIRRRDADGLAAFGLRGVAHLLVHIPHRYEREHDEAPVADLVENEIGAARGEVTACRVAGFGRKQRFEAVLTDVTGRVDLVWFNAPYLRSKIGAGTWLWVQGKAKRYRDGLQIANPKFRIVAPDDGGETVETTTGARAIDGTATGAGEGVGDAPGATSALIDTGPRLRPVYPASELAPTGVIERAVQRVLPDAVRLIEEHLPPELLADRALVGLSDAYRMVHAPADEAEADRGRRRLAYDELLMLQLGVCLKREHVRRRLRAPELRHDEATREAILKRLPFTLTAAQDRVTRELAGDLSGSMPANRLVQGDVGSGKTAVAAYGLLMAVSSGHQGALLAPTEILAEQHDQGLRDMLAGSGVRIELLTGAITASDRAAALRRIHDGAADIVIGTHAILTESVRFRSLAIAVIDEQHRFGVHQRANLREKGPAGSTQTPHAAGGMHTSPHVVVMTATPIPRTLGMTLFGDLDVSTIDELPPGRTPIETRVFASEDRVSADALLAERIASGERGYYVVPAIDPSETIASVRETVARLEGGALAAFRVASVTGRMDRRTREHVMERFRRGLIDCLVATTV
ncbi:MAG: DEAD/DEAH box helicase, partial [Planctomycetota bacterium]